MARFIWVNFPHEYRNKPGNYILKRVGFFPHDIKVKKVKNDGEKTYIRWDVYFTIKEEDIMYAYHKIYILKLQNIDMDIYDELEWKAIQKLKK